MKQQSNDKTHTLKQTEIERETERDGEREKRLNQGLNGRDSRQRKET